MQSIPSQSSLMISPSPSLTCYSSGNNTLADIAARVVRELTLQDELEPYLDEAEEFLLNKPEAELPQLDEGEGEGEGGDYHDDVGDGEFEFPFVCGGPESSPVSADEIFHNGQIRPLYEYSWLTSLGSIPPHDSDIGLEEHEKQRRTHRLPLKLLMTEDDPRAGEPTEGGFSCSSSESDELEGVPPETYCAWVPRDARGKQCKKSSSSGSGSRRWKLRHLLLNRSNSDGRTDGISAMPLAKVGGVNAGAVGCTKARGLTGGSDRRRCFVPYRSDLVGRLR